MSEAHQYNKKGENAVGEMYVSHMQHTYTQKVWNTFVHIEIGRSHIQDQVLFSMQKKKIH